MRRRAARLSSLLAGLLLAGAAYGWQRVADDTPDPGRATTLAFAGDGDVIAGGRFGAGVAADDGLVVRLAADDGAERWRAAIAGDGAGDDIVRTVAIHPSGDVVTFGTAVNTATGTDAVIARLTGATGAVVWRRDLDGASAGADSIRAGVVVDDDAIAVGATVRPDQTGPFVVWRLSGADGEIVWETHVDGPNGIARVVAVGDGALYVAGHVAAANGTSILVAKLDATTGTVAWSQSLAGTGATGDVVQAIAAAGSRVVVATELSAESTAPDVVVVALDTATGDEAWRRTFDGDAPGIDDDRAWALAIRPPDGVVVATTLEDATTADDLVVLRLDLASGTEAWRTTLDAGVANDDQARDLAVDPAGDVLVAGRSRVAGFDGIVAKLAGATGEVVWRSVVRGTSGGDAMLTVRPGTGVVAAGGFTSNGPGGDEFTVALLSATSGGSLPCGNGVPDAGEPCDDGNPIAGDGCRNDCTVERCGDGIRDPHESCDPGADLAGDCCSATCTPAAEGTACDDGDTCTTGEQCATGTCTPLPGAPCDDADPCTVDVCTLDGCAHSLIGGIPSATCVLGRPRIPTACEDLPASLARTLDRLADRLASAATATGKRQTRLLKATRKVARGARATARRIEKRLPTLAPCTQVFRLEMDDLIARVDTLLAQ